MDFNKWNSYMRYPETIPLFKDWDDLLGVEKMFARTHEMFYNSTMLLANNLTFPMMRQTPKGLDLVKVTWTGHLGGIDGLRQKGWTLFTVVCLKIISQRMGVDCEILGQGDNQVLICKYRLNSNTTVEERHQNFMKASRDFLSQIGPLLKLEET